MGKELAVDEKARAPEVPAASAVDRRIAAGPHAPRAAAAPVAQPGHAARILWCDVPAGIIAGLVLIAYCASFSSLLFQGTLRAGLSMGLWALLIGAAAAGLVAALTTRMPPIGFGPDTPVIAVLSVLVLIVSSQARAAGAPADVAARHALLALTAATLLSGVALLLLGVLRLGGFLRFIPYPVIGGFIAATAWMIVVNSLKVINGQTLDFGRLGEAVPMQDLPKVAVAGALALLLLLARRYSRRTIVLPVIFFGAAALLDLALLLGPGRAGSAHWYLGGMTELTPWLPWAMVTAGGNDWLLLLKMLPEYLGIALVVLVTLLVRVSTIEIAREKAADLDRELRTAGLGNLLAGSLGGTISGLHYTSSRILAEGGGGRVAGAVAALVVGIVPLAGIDLPALVPTPVLSGLIVYTGIALLLDVLSRPALQRSWVDLALTVLIMLVCVQWGYVAGVLAGVLCACIIFAVSYGRIGAVRRQLTRAEFSGSVERSLERSEFLRANGDAIHIYWLSGFLFFGSSEGVLESVRGSIRRQSPRPILFVVLDLGGVTGADTSAVMSLIKLRYLCDGHGIRIAYAGLGPALAQRLERARLFGGDGPHRAFGLRSEALQWCEDQLIGCGADAGQGAAESEPPFEAWLVGRLGGAASPEHPAAYFERREIAAGTVMYRQGAPSDTIDIVASGSVVVSLQDAGDRRLRIRRMAQRTVLGEMGFFRGLPRTASVETESAAVVYTLSRASFERMEREAPALASAFLKFVIATLSDRAEFANKEIAALL